MALNDKQILTLLNIISERYHNTLSTRMIEEWRETFKEYDYDTVLKAVNRYIALSTQSSPRFAPDHKDILNKILHPIKLANEYELTAEDLRKYLS